MRIIGIGSPFGDDQLGWRVADLLKAAPQLKAHLNNSFDIQISDRPGLTLLAAMDGIKTLYLIDALKAQDEQIGQICRIDSGALDDRDRLFSTHGFGVASAIQLATALGRIPDQTIIYAIKIGEIDYQSSLSPFIAKICQNLAEQMLAEIVGKLECMNA